MDKKDLEKLLEALHQELQETKSMDEKGRDLLRGLDVDIRGLLERSGAIPDETQESMTLRLQESLSHFEVTHPALTTLLSDLLTSLSNAGI
jgi:hypothetical protein